MIYEVFLPKTLSLLYSRNTGDRGYNLNPKRRKLDKIQNVGYSTRPLAWSLQKVNVIPLSIYTSLFHMRMCAHTRELH